MANSPQQSVIRARNKSVRSSGPDRMTDYDREQMKGYGFIYADGTYSDEREPRGATLVPRRPSPAHLWDPDAREWYAGEGAEVETNGERRFRQNSGGQPGGTLLPDRAAGPVASAAPSIPTLSSEAGDPTQEAIDRHKARVAADMPSVNIPRTGPPLAPKTDIYPTHSVAHSVAGVVTSGDPAASAMRPESSDFGKVDVGPAPTLEEVQASMERARMEAISSAINTSGAAGAVAEKGPAIPPQPGASNVSRPIGQDVGVGHPEGAKPAAPSL